MIHRYTVTTDPDLPSLVTTDPAEAEAYARQGCLVEAESHGR